MPTGGRVQELTPKDITQALRCPSARRAAVDVGFASLAVVGFASLAAAVFTRPVAVICTRPAAAISTRRAAVRHKVDSRETLGILL
jgi:hypothetical protein